jgi:hypothetical protein
MFSLSRVLIYIGLLILFIYTTSYGMWTWKKKNYFGAIIVFVLAVSIIALPVYTILTRG